MTHDEATGDIKYHLCTVTSRRLARFKAELASRTKSAELRGI